MRRVYLSVRLTIQRRSDLAHPDRCVVVVAINAWNQSHQRLQGGGAAAGLQSTARGPGLPGFFSAPEIMDVLISRASWSVVDSSDGM